MEIKLDDLTHPAVLELLYQHHRGMRQHSPEESVHALDIDALKASDISFWTVWIDNQIAACGALKKLDNNNSEIKSMRTSEQFLRQGVAARLLKHLIAFAKEHNVHNLWLETGTPDAFIPARKLYEHFGFNYCEPFGDYKEDPYSLFMVKAL